MAGVLYARTRKKITQKISDVIITRYLDPHLDEGQIEEMEQPSIQKVWKLKPY